MKQKDDVKTVEIFPLPVRRGRPSSPGGKKPRAQVQAEYRARRDAASASHERDVAALRARVAELEARLANESRLLDIEARARMRYQAEAERLAADLAALPAPASKPKPKPKTGVKVADGKPAPFLVDFDGFSSLRGRV